MAADRFRQVRRRAGAGVMRVLFEQAAQHTRALPRAVRARQGVEVLRDIPYLATGVEEHRFDLYRPAQADGPLPLVFYVHGGGFRGLSKDTHWMMGLAFAHHGFVVVLPSYRKAPAHRFPTPPDDVSAALAHVVENATSLGIDASQIILAGESAGANLITGLTLGVAWDHDAAHVRRLRTVPVRAVLAACGIYEVGRPQRFFEEQPGLSWFIRDRIEELLDYLPLHDGVVVDHELASPLLLAEAGPSPLQAPPPFFLPVGDRDPLAQDHVRLAQALRAHGVDVEAPIYPGEGHAFQVFVWREQARRFWRDTAAFLRARGVVVKDPPERVTAPSILPRIFTGA